MSDTTMTATARWLPIATAAGVAFLVATLGGLATDIGDWYAALNKPAWQPPGWVFGPVWTTIYALTAAAAVLAWWGSETAANKRTVVLVFAINAALNVLWSVAFFHLRSPGWALFEIAFLWLSILSLIVVSAHRHRVAPWLLAPYLAWVTFAAWLNFTIVRLNP